MIGVIVSSVSIGLTSFHLRPGLPYVFRLRATSIQISIPQPWFAVLSRGQRLLAGVVIGALIYMGGGVLDWFVTRQYLPRISLMLSGAAVSLAVALLVFKILTDVQRRYQAMVHRLQRIEELNHHIRNALQVIAYHNVTERSEGEGRSSTVV